MDNSSQYIVVGLGNPGKAYAKTRHNFGFMVIDRLAENARADFRSKNRHTLIAETKIAHQKVLLCKPVKYMNNSGISVKHIIEQTNGNTDNVLVVYDDLDLNLGKIRLRAKGSAGGHRGIQSIINMTTTNEFPRLRLGIGPQDEGVPAEDFVLEKFRKSEQDLVTDVIELSVKAIETFLTDGIISAMDKFNKMDLSLKEEKVHA